MRVDEVVGPGAVLSHRSTSRAIGARSCGPSPTSRRSDVGVMAARLHSRASCVDTARSPRSPSPKPLDRRNARPRRRCSAARPWARRQPLGKALEKGEVSGEHVDAAGAALRNADQSKRSELAKRIDALAGVAASTSAEEFGRLVRAEAERLAGDGGEERLARQQRAIRFNHRVDPTSGMIEVWGKLDPLRGMKFVNRLKARVSELFAEKTPDGCPSDPVEKHAYLQALALLDLCERGGGRAGPTRGHRGGRHPRQRRYGPTRRLGHPGRAAREGAHRSGGAGRRPHGRRA